MAEAILEARLRIVVAQNESRHRRRQEVSNMKSEAM
jgi:hypothetical protein